MKVLIIGGGGREATMAWKLAQSPYVAEILVAPGNDGMSKISTKIQVLHEIDFEHMLKLNPNLVVIGPEAPLCHGLSDQFRRNKILVIGPSSEAARLEGSKVFCKEVLISAGIPTAPYKVVSNLKQATEVIESWPYDKMVLKVDELAQGKGVIVCTSKEMAFRSAKAFFDGSFLGQKTERLIIEECLVGPEVSTFALCDGMDFLYLGSATDYKRLKDGDVGPNTGGMGTLSPSPVLRVQDEKWIQENVFKPLLKEMNLRGIPYQGFLFAGLIKTSNGFSVLEFNVRLGDPETQTLLPRIKNDLFLVLRDAAKGELKNNTIQFLDECAIHVVMCANGYPGVEGQIIQKGDEVSIDSLSPEVIFIPAAMKEKSGKLVTDGGRVCGVTALHHDSVSAFRKVYENLKRIHFQGSHYRTDIGKNFL